MYIPVTYEQDFDDLWMHLKSKYPEKLFNLDGVGEQLDMSKFSKKFFSSAVTSDASIDANANVDDMSVIAYEKELPKPVPEDEQLLYSLERAEEAVWPTVRGFGS